MNTIVGLMALVLVPLYVMRLADGQVKHDPLWQSGGNYCGFVAAVVAGGAVLRDATEPMHLALVIASLVWLVVSYHLLADRLTMANAIVNHDR